MEIITGKQNKARSIVVFGGANIGKTTFGVQSKDPIVIDLEDGCGQFDVPRTPRIKSAVELQNALTWVRNEKHNFKTLVIDSADYVEEFLHTKICELKEVETIQNLGYGVGKGLSKKAWNRFLSMLTSIREERGMDIILIAHDMLKKVEDPDLPPFDQHWPKMTYLENAEATVEWADDCLYAHVPFKTKTTEGNFGQEKVKALDVKEPNKMRCKFKPSVNAKNRLDMPEVVDLSYEVYDRYRQEFFKK